MNTNTSCVGDSLFRSVLGHCPVDEKSAALSRPPHFRGAAADTLPERRAGARRLQFSAALSLCAFLGACAVPAEDGDGSAQAVSAAAADEAMATASKLLSGDPETTALVSGSFDVASKDASVGAWKVFTLRQPGSIDVAGIDRPTQRVFAISPKAKYACFVDLSGGQACGGEDDAADGAMRRALASDLLVSSGTTTTASFSSALKPQGVGAGLVNAGASEFTASLAKLVSEAMLKAGETLHIVEVRVTATAEHVPMRAAEGEVVRVVEGESGTRVHIRGRAAPPSVAGIPVLTDFDRAFLESYAGKYATVAEGKIAYGEEGVKLFERARSETVLMLDRMPSGTLLSPTRWVSLFDQPTSLSRLPHITILPADKATEIAASRVTTRVPSGSLLVAGRSSADAFTSALRLVNEVWCADANINTLPRIFEALRAELKVRFTYQADREALRTFLLDFVQRGTLTKAEFDHFMNDLVRVEP